MRHVLVALAVLVVAARATSVRAAEHASWDEYVRANRYQCPGPFDTLKAPRTIVLGGRKYLHTGYRLEAPGGGAGGVARLGVLSAVKDASPATRENLTRALAWFRQARVDWIVANGDLALEELDLEDVMRTLGKSDVPVLLVPGNGESKAAFARAYKLVSAGSPGLVNGVLVRQIVGAGFELWTLPGYHDKAWLRQGASCVYGAADLDALRATLKPSGRGPVVLVAHGPPAGKGPLAIDALGEHQNVGDPALARLVREAAIPFGIFGHILEAAGTAVGGDLETPVASGKTVPALYVNAGSASGEPWKLNDGTTGHGMAMIVTVGASGGSYELKRLDVAE